MLTCCFCRRTNQRVVPSWASSKSFEASSTVSSTAFSRQQLPRGSRGSRGPGGSDLSFIEFSRVFSSLETFRGALPTAPGGSRRLSGGSERAQEASWWLRVALRALRSGFEASEVAPERVWRGSRGSANYLEPAGHKSSQLESAIKQCFHRLVLRNML